MNQKVTVKCWLNLQTHSAYMLFYKRVELEEENGKDFSFDVSPDLLEVPRVYFLKFELCKVHLYLRFKCYFNMSVFLSVDLARQHAVPPG